MICGIIALEAGNGAEIAMLYSLAEFLSIILPLLRAAKVRDIVEIGAEAGTMTRKMIAYTAEAGGDWRQRQLRFAGG